MRYTNILKEGIPGGRMFKNQKRVFLYALILTLIVFNLGIFMGYLMESSRIDKIKVLYQNAEIELLDQMIQKDSLEFLNATCNSLIKENINFGDKIFEEALLIQRYEDANELNDEIIVQHKRFDLLRSLFWINSIKIKQKCNADFHTVVYFYDYNSPTIEQTSKQRFFSNLLEELKQKQGDKIMLIPIAADNDIPSINLLLEQYKIEEFPTILIDEKIRISEVNNIEEVESYII